MTPDNLTVTLWNVEWARPNTARGRLVQSLLQEGPPEIVCVTEGYPGIFPAFGHLICSAEDFGYDTIDGRRKVMLWSANPWSAVDSLGHSSLPSGRFITGVTETTIGSICFVAVCIPWHDAHVRTGRRDRKPWEDHAHYLNGLAAFLESMSRKIPVVLLGDFNQRLPRSRQPKDIFDMLMNIIHPTFRVVTDGMLAGVDAQSIDHLVISNEFEPVNVKAFSNVTMDGKKLSDHFGLRVNLQRETIVCRLVASTRSGCRANSPMCHQKE